MIAGLGGDYGKTLISLGLITQIKKMGYEVQAFKKGPDYIDSAWLTQASGNPARNLDIYMMGNKKVQQSFLQYALTNGINIIEGNRGIFDGINTAGKSSSAELAKLIKVPVILIVNATKATRTLAAIISGIKNFDKDLNIAGIIINKISTLRHKKIVTDSIKKYTGIPIVGVLPELEQLNILPSRHLGLITPKENTNGVDELEQMGNEISKYIDIEKIVKIANSAIKLKTCKKESLKNSIAQTLKIGYFYDSAFTFYYPENLDALRQSGAELIPISAINDKELPDINLLYIGGGFPETHLLKLSENTGLLDAVRKAGMNGLPVYAECGGLIWLAESISYKDKIYELCKLLPLKINFREKPSGHGYCKVIVDEYNTFFPIGTKFKGHEFHYTEATPTTDAIHSVFQIEKGTGALKERDGIVFKNIFASYFHFHALGNKAWAKGLINAATKNYELQNKN
ncbi:MAG: cobyrinic acid a,c-diamide synthase [Ignavibacteria bacterium]|nr:cobyrinic acid a,c-diamide synthase [Ignavibacteria bacterium]